MFFKDKEYNRYDYYIIVLVGLLCFGSVGGALEPVRVLAILLVPKLYKTIKFKKCRNARSLSRVIFLIYLYMLISFIWTPDKSQALKELVYYPIHFILFLELIVFSKFSHNGIKSISTGWLIAASICSIVAIWELSTGNHLSIAFEQDGIMNLGGGVALDHFTASVTFMNYNGYNTFICFSFPWVFYILLDKTCTLSIKILSLSLLFISAMIIVINASRGGLLSVVIMLFIYYLLTKKTFIKNITLWCGIIIVGYFLINYGESVTAVMAARASEGGMFTDEARSVIWGDAMSVFYDSYGIGGGVGSVSAGMARHAKGGPTCAHNMFIEILCQYGIVIFLLVVFFILKQFKKAFKVKKEYKIVINMAIITMPIYSIINSMYLLDPSLFVLMASIYIFSNYSSVKGEYSIKTA